MIVDEKDEEEEDISDLDTELTLSSRRVANVISALQKLMKDEPDMTNQELETFLEQYKVKYNLTPDYVTFIALCGVFPPRRNIVKHWDTNQELFLSLVQADGKFGLEHFMQALFLYFTKKYSSELGKYGPTFMYKLLENNVIGEQFFLDWYN